MEVNINVWDTVRYSTRDVDKLLLAYRLANDFIQRIEQCREKLSQIDDRYLSEMAEYSRHFFEHGQPFKILQQHRDIPNVSKLISMSEQSLIALESWTN
ncbi:hypothetical protein COV93_03295 [Candidatus Woesearchaeota archaeon CG11_big_fil_rev_8_21_14_0_20_43_8]|nr:MAG: hypothetical protein COV93_03295 [Candidatus Woesearchaeota archaeon CG11_big_fil_rev_8_21_14_0_20_43_8]